MAEFVVRCEDELRDQVAAVAKREDRSMAAVVREAMRAYVAPKADRSAGREVAGATPAGTTASRPPSGEPARKASRPARCEHTRAIGGWCNDCKSQVK